jgi:hypothetical protein
MRPTVPGSNPEGDHDFSLPTEFATTVICPSAVETVCPDLRLGRGAR